MLRCPPPSAKASLGLLGLLLTAAVAVLLLASGGRLAVAETLDAPAIPHTVDSREQCLSCHAATVKPMPASHAGRAEGTCRGCHANANPAPATTGQANQGVAVQKATNDVAASDAGCVACHRAGPQITFGSGETLTATVNLDELTGSIHGSLSCTACHADKSTYPHAKPAAADRRSYDVAAAGQCASCHSNVLESFGESVHGRALSAGNAKAATCTDCHGVHNVAAAARLDRKPQLCSACHSVVTQTYQNSVHGQLLASGRADAASCLSCHTSDNSGHSLRAVADPDGPTATKNVPDTCGKCHPQALKTYNSTFHGRAMRLGVAGNAPNCVDCHGAYGVQRVHASESPIDETRFATACAKCHQGAAESFASGWMGHEEASPAWFPAVFFTERFLFFLTTSVVAFGILHVELDLLRWLVRRRRNGDHEEGK